MALIAAFASEVDLYMLDEPTSGLAPLVEQVFQECVLEQKKRGKGVLLSSHIMSEVERLCDRVGIIREGEVVETGTLDELRHLTRYTMQVLTEQTIEGLDKLPGVGAKCFALWFYTAVPDGEYRLAEYDCTDCRCRRTCCDRVCRL